MAEAGRDRMSGLGASRYLAPALSTRTILGGWHVMAVDQSIKFDPDAPEETWFPIPSVPGWELSNHYHLRRWLTDWGIPLPEGQAPKPVNLYTRGCRGYVLFYARGSYHRLHRIIMEVILGRRLRCGELVLHYDDVRTNNHPSNLRVGTHKQNAVDALRNRRYRFAYDLEFEQEAWRMSRQGWSIAALARHFGIQYGTMRNIILRQRKVLGLR
jgi:hypothetical protein